MRLILSYLIISSLILSYSLYLMTPRIRVSDLFQLCQAMEFLSNESQGSGRLGHREITATDSSSWASWGRRYITFVTLITCPNYKAFIPVPKGFRTIQIANKWRSTEEEFWRMCLPVRISPKTNVDGERPELLVSIWMNPPIKIGWSNHHGFATEVFFMVKDCQIWSKCGHIPVAGETWWNVMTPFIFLFPIPNFWRSRGVRWTSPTRQRGCNRSGP